MLWREGSTRLLDYRNGAADKSAPALLVVPFTYDYPEWSAVALVEAAYRRILSMAIRTSTAIHNASAA